MREIVISNNAQLFGQLGARSFQRLELDIRVASNGREALEMIASRKPSLAILDAEMPELDGYQVCQRIKADEKLCDTQVLLLHESLVLRDQLSLIEHSGCDGCVTLPIPDNVLFSHIAQTFNVHLSATPRLPANVLVDITVQGETIQGQLVQFTETGAQLELDDPPAQKQQLKLLLSRDSTGSRMAVDAHVAWTKRTATGTRVQVEFDNVDTGLWQRIKASCLWQVQKVPGGVRVFIRGEIVETTELEPLRKSLEGETRIEFDMSGVIRFNSPGVRTWCNFVTALGSVSYSFLNCSIAFTLQAAMVAGVLGEGTITSMHAPYFCAQCGEESRPILETEMLLHSEPIAPPSFACSCGGELEFDDMPARFFAFLL